VSSETDKPNNAESLPAEANTNVEVVVVSVKLDDLHDHPRQHALFGDLSGPEFAALVEDLRRNGQREPIRILSDGTILCGHQRVRAARELGWTKIDAIVVDVKDEVEAEELLISDNLNRRQLGPLGLARIYLAKRKGLAGKTRDVGRADLRDEIARRMGDVSGRTLDRYRRILQTPPVIQAAVESGQLAMSVALRVASLPSIDQAKIAEEIAAGAAVRDAVALHLGTAKSGGVVDDRERYRSFLNTLKRDIPAIAGVVEKVAGHGHSPEEAISLLELTAKTVRRLITQEKRKRVVLRKRIRAGSKVRSKNCAASS
jgi:ParB family transcriptional regulator, chromosome partitioning protein